MTQLPLGEWSSHQKALQHLRCSVIILRSDRAYLRMQPPCNPETENRIGLLNEVMARLAIVVAVLEAAPDPEAELREVQEYDVSRGMPPSPPWNET